MADLTIAGKTFPESYLYIGAGVIAAGYVGWRWWSASKSPSDQPVDGDAPASGSAPGSAGNVTYGTNPVEGDRPEGDSPRSNAEWSKAAIANMTASGFEVGFSSVAIGKWLAGSALTAKEAEAIQVAVSQTGQPPVGGPFPLNMGSGGSSPAPGGTSLGAPVLAPITRTANPWVYLSWSAVPGADHYVITATGNGNPGVWNVDKSKGTSERYWQGGPSKNTYTVRAVAPDGTQGPPSNSITSELTVKKG